MIVPADVDPVKDRVRLDVVLHGRGATLNEARFIASTTASPPRPTPRARSPCTSSAGPTTPTAGRGEADVFEAIEAVKRNYTIDERRIVLRGFSMGGAGAWHLGLHSRATGPPSRPAAGFSETKHYAKLDNLPEYQEKALHIYDAVDYAGNAFNVPIAGYGGEDDPQRQASINIEDALKALGYEMKTEGLVTRGEGIDFLRVVGAKMGHKVDPASAEILKAFHDDRAVKGLDLNPKRIKFTTYTLKYNQGPWLAIEAMEEHYRRALVDAEIQDRTVVVRTIENVAVLSVLRQMGETIRFGDQEFPLEPPSRGSCPTSTSARRGQLAACWTTTSRAAFEENVERGKRTTSRARSTTPSGSVPLRRRHRQGVEPRSRRGPTPPQEFRRRLAAVPPRRGPDQEGYRGDPRRHRGHHLILFGDPGSNRLLARPAQGPAFTLDRAEIDLGGRVPAGDHAPVLISAEPGQPAPLRRGQLRPHFRRRRVPRHQRPALPPAWRLRRIRSGPGGEWAQGLGVLRRGLEAELERERQLVPAPRPQSWVVPGPLPPAWSVVAASRVPRASGGFSVGRRSIGGAGLPELLELAEGAERDASREGVLGEGGRWGRGSGGPDGGPRWRRPLECPGPEPGPGSAVMGAWAGSRSRPVPRVPAGRRDVGRPVRARLVRAAWELRFAATGWNTAAGSARLEADHPRAEAGVRGPVRRRRPAAARRGARLATTTPPATATAAATRRATPGRSVPGLTMVSQTRFRS